MGTHVVGHANPDTDAVCAAIGYAEFRCACNTDAESEAIPAIQGDPNPETRYVLDRFDVEPPTTLRTAPDGGDVALVDHSDWSQAPDGLEPEQIVAVIDHHRVGDIQTTWPIVYRCAPVGSTATIVAELFADREETPTDATRGCLLGAILSDTLGFQSPTTTDRDKRVAQTLADSLGIDPDAMATEQLRAKADLSGASPMEILRRDLKTYETPAGPLAISQVELPDADAVLDDREAYRDAMADLRTERGGDVVFAVTDLERGGSYLLVEAADTDPYERAFDVQLSDTAVPFLPDVLSRKRQFVPPLLAALSDH